MGAVQAVRQAVRQTLHTGREERDVADVAHDPLALQTQRLPSGLGLPRARTHRLEVGDALAASGAVEERDVEVVAHDVAAVGAALGREGRGVGAQGHGHKQTRGVAVVLGGGAPAAGGDTEWGEGCSDQEAAASSRVTLSWAEPILRPWPATGVSLRSCSPQCTAPLPLTTAP